MAGKKKVLFLAHRIPYPPDKGDKIRSWRLLQFLAERFDVCAGFFVDDPNDHQFVPHVAEQCHEVKSVSLNPAIGKITALRGLLTGEALTFPYYKSGELSDWVREMRTQGVDLEVAFSSSMAPYLAGASAPVVVDLVDADSAKWAAYAAEKKFPMSWIYNREASLLAKAEAGFSRSAAATFLISEAEAALVRDHPDAAPGKIFSYQNGVDATFFDPGGSFQALREQPDLIFTGAMDYAPNAEAVLWFVREVWPSLRKKKSDITFAIVGARPGGKIQALGDMAGITVTGRVDDIRPWLASAKVAIAPLQIARGQQNKVLEAMAMAKPVVASSGAVKGIDVTPGTHLWIADEAMETEQLILSLLSDDQVRQELGQCARALVESRYVWDTQMGNLAKKLTDLQII